MNKTLSVLLLINLAAILIAEESTIADLTSTESCAELSKKIAEKFAYGKIQDGMDLLLPHFYDKKADASKLVDGFSKQYASMVREYGKGTGWEIIGQEKAGDSLLKVKILQKHESYPIKLLLYFYKPEKTWIISYLKWDNDFTQLFDSDDRATPGSRSSGVDESR